MRSKIFLLVLGLLAILNVLTVAAQDIVEIQCGDILEGEVIQSGEEDFRYYGDRWVDEYSLNIQAGTHINLIISPLGASFNVAFAIRDSGGNYVLGINEGIEGVSEDLTDYQLGSSNQLLHVMGARPGRSGETSDVLYDHAAGMYFGAYEIRIGCTLRDGTVIEPGDSAEETGGDTNNQPVVPAFSGFGFPGLAPVDFASAFRLPLTLGTAMEGEIPPSGDAVLGFRFDGTAGDILDLSFARTTGNLNLGLAVLSAENQVAYMAALVSSSTMNTNLTLPSTSEYTIGVFRLDLIPPAAPEATGFQITAVLNP